MGEAEESRFYSRAFWVVAGGLLAVALFAILRPFLESILWAGLLALLISPLNDLLSRKLGGRPALAAILLTLAGALFVLIPAKMTPVTTAGMSTKSAPASVRRMAARAGRPPSFLDKRSLSGLMSKARRPAHRIDSRKGLRMAKRATANSPPATTQNALE